MANIMICVTGQMECARLIRYALTLQKEKRDELYLVHVSAEENKSFTDSIEALQYLYAQASENGASLNVLKSKNVLDTLQEFVIKHKIDVVVMGESNATKRENSMIERLQDSLKKKRSTAEIHKVARKEKLR